MLWFGKKKKKRDVKLAQRYDSARPSERFHWKHVDSKSVDASLDPETRRIQRERARYEIANNSWAYGAAMTLANAVVGNGPRLQLVSREGNNFEEVEWAFAEWSEEVRLGEKLRAMRFARFQDGESFAVLFDKRLMSVNVKRRSSPASLHHMSAGLSGSTRAHSSTTS